MPPYPLTPPSPPAACAWQVVDFGAPMSARELLFWRACFEHLLCAAKRPGDAAAPFVKCAGRGRGAVGVPVARKAQAGGPAPPVTPLRNRPARRTPPPPLPPAACRLAAQPQLGALRSGLASFLKHKVGPWLAAREGGEEVTALLQGVRAVERALGGKA